MKPLWAAFRHAGNLGEYHSSIADLHANKTAVSNIVEAELFTLLPTDRKINVRVPAVRLRLIPSNGDVLGLGFHFWGFYMKNVLIF